MRGFLLALLCCALAPAAPLAAQTQQPSDAKSNQQERLGENHFKLTGNVELTWGDSTLFADELEIFYDQNRAIATGNVTLTQGKNRISADRADFNTKTHLGTFYNASGIASVQPPRQQATGGIVVPTPLNQETDVYFYGEQIEKIGPKKYKITNGGFSTCVQPTPRWQLTSDTVILNIDHYTFLRNSIFTVKGVPMLYLPVMYYPTKKEDRATGFLIPTYGSSTFRGQTIHDAFFWAINRSQDATFLHDWYSKTGQGVGSEYRYNYGPGSNGNFRGYFANERETTYATDAGTTTQPASKYYDFRGGANQVLPFGLRARANVDYASSVQTAQTFSTDPYYASRRTRTFGGNVVGVWGIYSLNSTFDRNETFYGDTSSVSGNAPRIVLTRTERPLWTNAPIYFSMTGESAHMLAHSVDANGNRDQNSNYDVSRFDVSPQIRYPFKKWQWFTINSTILWRDTYFSRSQTLFDPIVPVHPVDEAINRRFFTLQSQITGPVFNRIWNTPDSGYAEKFKHTIEPVFTIARTSNVDNATRVLFGNDQIFGGTTFGYGVNNRFYAKRRPGKRGLAAGPSIAREILSVQLTQSYYTNQTAAQFDPRFTTSFTTSARVDHFTPVQLSIRTAPTDGINGTMQFEWDSRSRQLATLSAQTTMSLSSRLQANVGWSKRNVIPDTRFSFAAHAVNAGANLRTQNNRLGSVYSFNYDITRSTLVQQRISGYYNAQCCGLAMEYQTYNFGAFSPIPVDHRFFLSFTLAGLGNFSPFNGALGGVPR